MSIDIMLDSGAYSAWSRGEHIDINEYIEFCFEHQHDLFIPVNLDVIPGRMGKKPTKQEIDDAAQTGFNNWQMMLDYGLDPMPVFHIGEDIKWLDAYLESGASYIGLGGIAKASSTVRKEWLDNVFNYLCGDAPYCKVKIHGFGVTSIPMIYRYPWYSVDSTAWSQTGGFGGITIPAKNPDGSWDYSNMTKVGISDGGDTGIAKAQQARHFKNLGKAHQNHVFEFIEHCGVKAEAPEKNYLGRALINTAYFVKMEEEYKHPPYVRKNQGLFTEKLGGSGVSPADVPHDDFRIFLSLTGGRGYDDVPHVLKSRNRLISYLAVGENADFKLMQETGCAKVCKEPENNVNNWLL